MEDIKLIKQDNNTVLYDKDRNIYADNKDIIYFKGIVPSLNVIDYIGRILTLNMNETLVLKMIYKNYIPSKNCINKQAVIDDCMKKRKMSRMTYIRAINVLADRHIILLDDNLIYLTDKFNIYDYINKPITKYIVLQVFNN